MGRPRSPWSIKLIDLLTPAGGGTPQWVSFDDIVDQVLAVIPDENAESAMRIHKSSSVETGRRSILNSAISSLRVYEQIEVSYKSTRPLRIDKIRLTPKGMSSRPELSSKVHPWTVKVVETLKDGEWHSYEEIQVTASPCVPPGMAWRKAEEARLRYYSRSGKAVEERTRGDRNDTIKTGQRYYVRKSITDLRRSGRIEVEYSDQVSKPRPLRMRLNP